MARLVLGSFLLSLGVGMLPGCAVVSITSEPTDAAVVYSRTGQPPWRPWPPGASSATLTPAQQPVRGDPYYFLRVQKQGYFPTQPVFVDAAPLRRQTFRFQLEPTPELFAKMQRDKGLVFFEGKWVDPKKEDLVEFQGRWMRPKEKFILEQQLKGMVFYEPQARWMTPQEIEALDTKQKQELGLVRFKDRWIRPFEADLQRLVDSKAEAIAASSATFELRIDRIGPVFTPGAELRVSELSGHPLEVLLSGPQSHRAFVPPYLSMTTQTLPGNYLLVIHPDDSRSAPAAVGRIRLEAKTRYSAIYRGVPVVKPKYSPLQRPVEVRIEPSPLKPITLESVLPPPKDEKKK